MRNAGGRRRKKMRMLRAVSLAVLIICLIPAVHSRQHNSKYKGFCRLPQSIRNRVADMVRKSKALNQEQLWQETDRVLYQVQNKLWKGLLLVSTGLLLVSFFSFLPSGDGSEKTERAEIQRPSVGETEKSETIELIPEDSKETKTGGEQMTLRIEPREYTEQEFQHYANQIFQTIEETWNRTEGLENVRENGKKEELAKGEETGIYQLTKNIQIPLSPEKLPAGIELCWHSSEPEQITSRGEVQPENINSRQSVFLTAEISDGKRRKTREYEIQLAPEPLRTETDSGTAAVKKMIQEKEETSRSKDRIRLPESFSGYKIRVVHPENQKKLPVLSGILLLGIVLLSLIPIQRLKEKGKKRQEELEEAYAGLISRLCLLMGAGYGIRSALFRISDTPSRQEKALNQELQFCVNRMRAGISEKRAIEEMGRSIGLAEYMRFSSLVSQNISHGNSNLLNLLRQEAQAEYFRRRERIRKRGQQASEKLLIPTFLLLILVIGVVMVPALMSL